MTVYPPTMATTTDPVRFVIQAEQFVWFHDRIRGVKFRRGPAWQPLPHRYMKLAARDIPERYRDQLPERYR